jgi:glycosyltransferase involved in cell wall biosynthesis
VDLDWFKPARDVAVDLGNGITLGADAEVITYVSRSLEPFRGFPQFLQAVARLQRRRPRLQVLVAGNDEVTYSPPLPNGLSYREQLCRELDLDLSRIHFLGWLRGDAYRRLLQVSSAHVYLTPPFVLSWSMVEAMAAGCVVVASATAPVQEVIRDGENGLLFDFFAPEQLADAVEAVLDHPRRRRDLGLRARQQVARHYDVKQSIACYRRLLEGLTGLVTGL